MDLNSRRTGHYSVPGICPVCHSSKIETTVYYDTGIVRICCIDCGFDKAIPKEEARQKRTNTALTNWARQVVYRSGACAICGNTINLEAHHIIPVSHSEKHKYMLTNGIALCKECHYLVHNKVEGKNDAGGNE